MRLAKGIWLIVLIILIVLVGGTVIYMLSSYDTIIDFAIEQIGRPDLKTKLEQSFFTEFKFRTLQRMGYSIIPILLAIIGFLIVKRKLICRGLLVLITSIKNYTQKVIASIRNSSKNTKIVLAILLFLVIIRSVYYATHYYLQYDECWNYNYFLSNNISTTLLAYNNYPLHNIITFFFLKILPDTAFVLRLPNIFLGAINLLIIFSLCKKLFNRESIALMAVALFTSLPTAVFYMLFARGVMLSLTFGLLLLFFFLLKKIETWNKADIVLIAIFGALGCFAMISFPFFIILLFAIALFNIGKEKNKNAFSKLCYAGLLLTFFSAILYLPMFLGTGLSLGFSSDYTSTKINWSTLLSKANFVSRNQIGFYWGAYIFLAMNIILLFFCKRKTIIALNILLLLLPFLTPIMFKTYFPARALGFQAFAYLFTLILVLEILIQKSNKTMLYGLSFALVLGFGYVSHTHTFLGWSAARDRAAFEVSQVLQSEQIDSYYDVDGTFFYFVPGILYYHLRKGKQIKYQTSNTSSARFMSLGSYSGNCFVADTKNYQPLTNDKILYTYQDEDKAFTVYLRTNSGKIE